jgi:hypothetical protein
MYAVIRKISNMQNMSEAARRAESGLAPILKQQPGFRAYHVLDFGNGAGGSISFFESREAAQAANAKALAWIRENLAEFYTGEPEVTTGEVLVSITG